MEGDNYLCFCCFHDNNNTPALGVHMRTGIFGCYSCGASGNFFDLIAQTDNLSAEEVVAVFTETEFNLPKEKLFPKNINNLVLNQVKKFNDDNGRKRVKILKGGYLKQYKTNELAYRYLLKRGIAVKTSRAFNIRWGGSNNYWSSRVIFPIFDRQKRLVSISGRHTQDNTQANKMRHLFGSQQRHGLFGYEQARRLIRLHLLNFVVIVEGQIDSMSLYEINIPSVALGKMIISDEQISAITSIADIALIGVDSDVEEKNVTAIPKMVAKLREFMICKRLRPMEHDWNDCILKHSKKKIRNYIKVLEIKKVRRRDCNENI